MKSEIKFLKSFLYAGRGLKVCLAERNMRFHISTAVLVTAFSHAYGLSHLEYGLLFFTIGAVFSLEAVNTAIERLTDLASPQRHPLAGAAKDAAAGAVLIMAVASVVIGCCLFLHFPKLTDTLFLIMTTWRLPVYLALIIAGYFFTFKLPLNSSHPK